jgi:DNA-binding response OmpR family regulator
MNLQSSPINDRCNHEEIRILLVDDDADLLSVTQLGLERRGFEVVAASSVNDALRRITSEHFDVLLSDLHIPHVGDGYTLVSAMRHTHPKAVTLVLSGYPAIQESVNAIMLQADEVILKPVGVAKITEIINQRLSNPRSQALMNKENVAAILERDVAQTIQLWMSRVECNEELMTVPLPPEQRTGHLPLLLADLAQRLRCSPGTEPAISSAAREHGALRRIQGYTVALMVEESRILQVSIFKTLQNNLPNIDFDTVLLDVMTIADEVDSQLKQAVLGFTESEVPQAMQITA